jgi:uncharacterized protein
MTTMRLWHSLALCGLLAGLAAPVTAAPSFDCKKAKAAVEKAICKDKALSDLDAAIARAYAAALERVGTGVTTALRDDQRTFVTARDLAHSRPDENLADRLKNRLSFFERLTVPGDGFVGTWENALGTVAIKMESGKHAIKAEAGDPVSARWVCDTSGESDVKGGALTFTDGDTPAEDTATIKLRRNGPLLAVNEDVKDGKIRGYCGHNGALEGRYFAVKAAE